LLEIKIDQLESVGKLRDNLKILNGWEIC